MSSNNAATRRPLKARVPTTVTAKDTENATARSRLTTRAKGVLGSASSTAAPSKSATTDSKATTAAAQSKRKREALGELSKRAENNDKAKKAAGGAGKGKDTATAPLKGKATTTNVTSTARVPLRPIGGTRKPTSKDSTTSIPAVKVEPPSQDEHAMAIDPAADENDPRPTTRSRSNSASTTTSLKGRSLLPVSVPTIKEEPEAEYEETVEPGRPSKKARTSSEAPHPEEEDEAKQLLGDGDHDDAPEIEVPGRSREAQQRAMWDDLDAPDADDPVMVSEYVSDIFLYLRKTELTTMPNPTYMESQKELAWKMRGILIDWLIQMHSKFRLIPETLFLCVNIIDRFLSVRVCSLAKLQLVGATSLLLAAKVEEIIAPGIDNIVWHSQNAFDAADVIKAEQYLLKSIDWNLSYPNPMHFLRRVNKAEGYEPRTRTLAKYLLEVGIIEWRLIGAPPSLLATAAIWLARLITGCGEWNESLENYSAYPEDHLIPTANLMLNYILRPIKHESLYKKYASKKFLKVSLVARDWALRTWQEGTSVPLAKELPTLRRRIEKERKAAEEAGENEYGDENDAGTRT